MHLDLSLRRELLELGVLAGDETCVLCDADPVILVEVGHTPLLFCQPPAREIGEQLLNDGAGLAPPTQSDAKELKQPTS